MLSIWRHTMRLLGLKLCYDLRVFVHFWNISTPFFRYMCTEWSKAPWRIIRWPYDIHKALCPCVVNYEHIRDNSILIILSFNLYKRCKPLYHNMMLPHYAVVKPPCIDPSVARFRVSYPLQFWTRGLTLTPINLVNQVKLGHALDQSRSVQLRGPEGTHQNNELP